MDEARINRHGFRVLFEKELTDHLESWRFWILFLLLIVVGAASLRGAVNSLTSAAQQASAQGAQLTDFMFLKLFTTSGSAIYSFSTFLAFLGPVIGIMLGFDAISSERAGGTLNRLAAQPIYRDTIINAKFLAGSVTLFLTVFSAGLLFTAGGILISGIEPRPEELARIVIYLLIVWVYMSLWLAIAVLFSVLSKHAATAALGCIALWLFFTMFLSLLASGLAGLVFPGAAGGNVLDVISAYRLSTGINRISPYYLLSEVTTVLMNPNVRSLDIMSTLESQNGAIASYLPLGQSLLQIWPQTVAMIAEAVICFGAGYVCFMNKEIRA